MSYHPSWFRVDIVGTEESSTGQSCEEHNICGKALTLDAIVHLYVVQII
jgi:hypothetical protein